MPLPAFILPFIGAGKAIAGVGKAAAGAGKAAMAAGKAAPKVLKGAVQAAQPLMEVDPSVPPLESGVEMTGPKPNFLKGLGKNLLSKLGNNMVDNLTGHNRNFQSYNYQGLPGGGIAMPQMGGMPAPTGLELSMARPMIPPRQQRGFY